MRSPQGDIRLALNISQSRATQIARSVACYQGAGLQHAAFACRDLPAACDQLAEVARHTLPIPANYYDDLLARFGGELDVGSFSASSSSMTAIRRGEISCIFTPGRLPPAAFSLS